MFGIWSLPSHSDSAWGQRDSLSVDEQRCLRIPHPRFDGLRARRAGQWELVQLKLCWRERDRLAGAHDRFGDALVDASVDDVCVSLGCADGVLLESGSIRPCLKNDIDRVRLRTNDLLLFTARPLKRYMLVPIP